MTADAVVIAGGPARRAVEVRVDGRLIKRVSPGAADTLVERGWAEWRGSGRRRYAELTASAPLSALHGWRGADGTRPLRGDQTCKHFGADQLMGAPESHREFSPLS